jgi:hypothetical protein
MVSRYPLWCWPALAGVLLFVLVPALLVTASPAVAETCPNAEFRTGPSANLPDCRAYEQVTPVEKGGGVFYIGAMGPGADGTTNLITRSFADIAGLQSGEGFPGGIYSSVRSGSGWVTSALPPPASEYENASPGELSVLPDGVSLDARSGLWLERRRSWPKNRADLFVTRPGGAIEDVGTVTPPNLPPAANGYEILRNGNLGLELWGWSDDLSHVLYQQKSDFWPSDTTHEGAESLYELVGTGNTQPMLVGLGSNGELISDCGTELGGIHSLNFRSSRLDHNAVSADGSTVFFTADECGGSPPAYEVFARIDNGQPDAHTVAISEPTSEDCSKCNTSEPAFAIFEGASADGSKAFFATEQPLLGSDSTLNIYEYDFDAPPGERVIRVSGGDSTVSNPKAEVEGVVVTSEDGSHVYFVAHGVLTTTPNGQGQSARAGADNLYMFERDAQYPAGRTAFIADLAASDESLWFPGGRADVTPNGRFLVFPSTTDHLTSDDTSTAAQIFEYDAQTGSLTRVSIGQGGYNDNGNTDVAEASILTPGYDGSSTPTAYWSDLSVAADGSVFFQSTDGLTPQALNQRVIAETDAGPLGDPGEKLIPVYGNNIYEYQDGNVYLLSDGHDVYENSDQGSAVELLGTDESGADVFFTSADRLVPQDTDSDIDIYDARIDGGFPAPVSPPECSGDGCQGPLSSAPTLLSPGSEFQAGGGNLASGAAQPVVKPKKARKKAKRKATGKKDRETSRSRALRGRAHRKGGRS